MSGKPSVAKPAKIHPSSAVAASAKLGEGTQVWMFCQIRDNAVIGRNCVFGKGVYVDNDVTIGDCCKLQNNVSVYLGVTLENGVFAGPHVCFTNDKQPRAVNPDGSLKSASDWVVTKTLVREGAALGANSTIVCGVTVGRWAMVGSGSVVTRDVPDYGLVVGNPARLVGYVCPCGAKLGQKSGETYACPACQREIALKD